MLILGVDFTTVLTSVTVPASISGGIQTFQLPQFYTVIDDNIDEFEQSFALIVEIGPDVPTNCHEGADCSCFQTILGDSNCYGRTGATEIRIRDNDCKFTT